MKVIISLLFLKNPSFKHIRKSTIRNIPDPMRWVQFNLPHNFFNLDHLLRRHRDIPNMVFRQFFSHFFFIFIIYFSFNYFIFFRFRSFLLIFFSSFILFFLLFLFLILILIIISRPVVVILIIEQSIFFI